MDKHELEKTLNLELRGEILSCSLALEKLLNSVLLLKLGIQDRGGNKTRLFGKKAGISFKNKIDLLYDIDELSKEEWQDLEFLMSIRNRFMHDIDCNSFSKLDEGKNRLEKYLENNEQRNEQNYKKAFMCLYKKTLSAFKNKLESIPTVYKLRADMIIEMNTQEKFLKDLSNIKDILEESNLLSYQLSSLSMEFSNKENIRDMSLFLEKMNVMNKKNMDAKNLIDKMYSEHDIKSKTKDDKLKIMGIVPKYSKERY